MLKWPVAMNAGQFDFHITRHFSASKGPRSLWRLLSPAHLCVIRNSSLRFHGPDYDKLGFRQSNSYYGEQDHLSTDCLPFPRISDKDLVAKKLTQGENAVQMLQGMRDWQITRLWHVLDFLFFNNRFVEAFKVLLWYQQQEEYNPDERNYCRPMSTAAKAKCAGKIQATSMKLRKLCLLWWRRVSNPTMSHIHV